MDRSWVHGVPFTPRYIDGVNSFMNFIKERFNDDEQILCPCAVCLNSKYLHQNDVQRHLLLNGMSSTYTRWIDHGEDSNVHVLEEPVQDENANYLEEPVPDDGLDGMLNDLVGSEHVNDDGHGDGNLSNNAASRFKKLIEEARRELYPGCTNFSRLSFVIKMLHVKSLCRITNSAFSMFMKILSEAFPEFNTCPKSYDEAKKMLLELGLGYASIHVCPNNCVLFRKTYKGLDNCPVCKASRWKDPENKKVPVKRTCDNNKENRSKVQFHQATGSRSYEMQLINLANNKYQNEPPNALDIFKDLHYSNKKGFTPTVQAAIVEIEDKINAPVDDGEGPKDVADVVFEVLSHKTKKNSFLTNVGMKRSSASEDNADIQRELEAELVAEKQINNDLRETMKTQQVQMDEMMKKMKEAEAARAIQDEEMKKRQAETDALIKGLISMLPACLTKS